MALETKQSRRATARKKTEQHSPSSSPWILAKPTNYVATLPLMHKPVQTLETRKTRRERKKQGRGPESPHLKLSRNPLVNSYPSPSQSSLTRTLPPNLSPADFVRSSPQTQRHSPFQKHSPLNKKSPSNRDSPLQKHSPLQKNSPLPPTKNTPQVVDDDIKVEPQPVVNGYDEPKPPSTLPIENAQETPQNTLRGRPHISSPQSTRMMTSKTPMPSDEVLNILFDKLLDQLNLTPEKVAEMNSMSPQQKWSLILAQRETNAGLSCMYYIEQLVRHSQPALKEKKVKRKLLDKLHPLGKVLKELEVELRTNAEGWIDNFVASPNHGHIALIDLLKDLIQYPSLLNTTQKISILQRSPSCVHTSLTCVKALMSNRSGFTAVFNYAPSVFVITHCISFPHHKTKTLVLKLLILVLLVPSGPQKILQAFEHYRRVKGEKNRFEILVNSMFQEPMAPSYQAEVLRFINTVVQAGDGPNARIFHQQEFLNAGLDIKTIEQTLECEPDEKLMHELKEWKKSFTDVQKLTDELLIARGRANGLKQELDMTLKSLRQTKIERDSYYDHLLKMQDKSKQQDNRVKTMTDEITNLTDEQHERSYMVKQIKQLQEVNQHYRQQTSQLRNKIEESMGQEALQDIDIIDPSFEIQDQVTAFKSYTTSTIATQTIGSTSDLTDGMLHEGEAEQEALPVPEPPPLPPNIPAPPPLPNVPLPPPLPGMNTSLRKPYITNLPLPTLNWVPLRNTNDTIFDGMDDNHVIEEIDFSEFETLFQVPRFKSKEVKTQPVKKQVELFDSKRTRGILFAKRRVRKEPEVISEMISNVDLDGLITEHCELLISIVPQESERETLAKNASDYETFGEAEQFLYQLAKIPRLEERLGVMSFMGGFDEILLQTQPRIDAVLNASLSIHRSSRLKKVFEVILAFGNYMNSSKRGTATGFKLASLERLLDTNSTDKKQNLLHYITHVVEKVYPNLLLFYEDLTIGKACEVSLEMVNLDVENIKQGFKTLKEEQESDPQNFIIFSFVKQVSSKVEELLEEHQKMKHAYTEVCRIFSELPTEEPAKFFDYFRKFINSWKMAIKDNHKKNKKMAPASGLLKKPKNPEELMRDLATEAAIVATARMNKTSIQEDERVAVPEEKSKPKVEKENKKEPASEKPVKTSSVKKGREASAASDLLEDEYYSTMDGTVSW
ncbi:PREDICTED: formin-like protein 3 [Amphimedon queenslandica]|uniref:FH2 domain-containing protein n=1 Tax=Amphimedon queenslandica TaxID=400682 RepID=A0A1X7VU84_AMPQE|nr:PREDICTED: formin-like protein 3 [Amphimedon queenslandica]|eukprot:XP_019853233.1 PREDICTED: formin-like protein 3 [Amphimedon queenslandica]